MTTAELGALFVAVLPAAICACVGGYMALRGVEGWGWLLFVAVLLYPSGFSTGKAAEINAQRKLEESRKEPTP